MKILLLTVLTAISATPAAASVLTLGSNYAESCYHAAENRIPDRKAFDACDNALHENALTLNDRVGTHVNRGILKMISGDYVGASTDFDTALSLDAHEPEAWLNKAILGVETGQSQDSVDLAAKALELKTLKPAMAYYVRALAYEDKGNLRAAYADYRRAAELDPRWSAPKLELARYQVRSR